MDWMAWYLLKKQESHVYSYLRKWHSRSHIMAATHKQPPVQAGEKKFKYEQKVKLVNPKLYGRGYAIGDMGHTDYVLLADDIVAVEEK